MRRSRSQRARGGEEDRISGLPTDLLLRILTRVGDARAALVSRRWCGLWALLPEFHLIGGRPSTISAMLSQLKECHFDAAALLPRCPHLRVLKVEPDVELDSPVSIDLPMLEELPIAGVGCRARFHIVAPMLKHLHVPVYEYKGCFGLSTEPGEVFVRLQQKLGKDGDRKRGATPRAEAVQDFRLHLFRRGLMWIGDGVGRLLQQLPRLHVLRINISKIQAQWIALYGGWSQKLPKTNILILQLSACGHEFGAIVLRLLQMVEGVDELKMLVDSPKETCYSGCPCHHLQFRTNLSLPLLKNVEFKGFNGAKSAVYVMELLFSSAKALEQMTVGLRKGSNQQ
ncbi:unnamed protein product [Urochloa decumbens]|uniref:F-box domain-containing protein n=1 Tax=Urochloa decumbens TaxID=240449 RepID=A0ABC9ENM5_9POAL